MVPTEEYSAIVIGAGQAGGPLASALAQAGRRTVLVERAHVGGTCINEGCTPTKTMVASARIAWLAQRAADYGVQTGDIGINMNKVRQRKRRIVEDFRSSSERRIAGTDGLDFIAGEASFIDAHTVEVLLDNGQCRRLTADTIFINTGARPAFPPVPGLDQVPALDSTSIMELNVLPEHLLVIGGGYIGLEFGQMFRRFGSRVTIVQRAAQLLGREDPDVAAAVADIMREDGIELLLETNTVRVEPAHGEQIMLTVNGKDGERTLSGSHLLVAAGRVPNIDALNLSAAGVQTARGGFIAVNERLQTSVPHIYALGDVNGGPAFTHISYDDFRVVRANILSGGDHTTTDRFVPYTVFIDPQLGRVGLNEQEARAQGRDVRVAKIPMTYVARALEVDETRGFMKALVDTSSGQILGFTILGIEGGEIMSMVQVAMMGKLPYTKLRDAVFAHPTLAESLNTLFASLGE